MCINKYLPFNKTFRLSSPVGPPCFVPRARDYGVLGFQSSSICCACPRYAVLVLNAISAMWLSSIRCACPRNAMPVLNTLCLSSIRCACPWCAVPVLNMPYLSSIRCACPRYAVPVLIRWAVLSLCLFSIRCAYRKYAELAFGCACSY